MNTFEGVRPADQLNKFSFRGVSRFAVEDQAIKLATDELDTDTLPGESVSLVLLACLCNLGL